MITELLKIVLTASLTLLGGVLIFCITTVLNKLFIEPVLSLRKILSDISFCIQCNAATIISTPANAQNDGLAKIYDEIRSLTARMRADANSIPCYFFFARAGIVPKYRNLIKASGHLTSISNLLGSGDYKSLWQDLHAVQDLLGVDIGRPEYKKDANP